MSEITTRKNVKYIDNGNISSGMLNRSKLHLNRFGTIQLVKGYRETFKNTIQENLIDSITKLKLSKPHKIMVGHLNVNSLRNKFE